MFRPLFFLILSLYSWLNCSTVNAIEWSFSPSQSVKVEDLIRKINPRTGVTSLAFSPDGKWLASGSEDSVVRLWSLEEERREVKQFTGHRGVISSIAFSPDSRSLASAALEDNVIRVWNVAQNQEVKLLQGHEGPVSSVAFSPDGQYLASGSQDTRVVVWTVNQGQPWKRCECKYTEGVTQVAFSPDGHWLASASWDSQVKLWNWQTTDDISLFNYSDSIFSIAFSPDSQWLAAGGDDKRIHLRNLKTGTENNEYFSKRKAAIRSIAFSFDGKYLISIADDGSLYKESIFIDEVPEQFEKKGYSWLPTMILNKQGMLAVGAQDGSIQFYDMQTGEIQHLFVIGANKGNWLSCDIISLKCLKSYSFIRDWLVVVIGIFFLITYFLIYHHPLVTELSANANHLLTLPLAQLAKARRLLQLTLRFHSVLTTCQVPTETFNEAVAFTRGQPLQQTEILAKRLSAHWEQKTERLFILSLPAHFPLNLTHCALYFPEPSELTAVILEQLRYCEELELKHVIIITLVLKQQLALRPYGEDITTPWIVPDDRELTQWLLAVEPLTVIARTFSTQLRVTQISPYQTWGAITKDTLFFGRAYILTHVLNRNLSNYLVVGGRKVGKSSLLRYLERYYQRQPEVVCHYLQLPHERMVERLATKLNLPEHSNLEEILDYLLHTQQRYLFLIDETDKWIQAEIQQNYPTLTVLRSFSEEGHGHFILAGFWNLYQATILDYHSPLKNFGEVITLGGLETDACRDLIVKPLHSLNIQMASETLIQKLIYVTGKRANLIALICNEMLKNLDMIARTLGEKEVIEALNSSEVQENVSGWEQFTSDPQANHLDRLIIYATIRERKFTLFSLLKILENYGDYSLEAINRSLERLTLGFVIRQDMQQCYTYCVPLFQERLLQENVEELLKWELKKF